MTKASDNQYPKVTFLESSAPSTPASTLGYLYEKTDGKIYFKNDAGTEYDLTTGGSGETLSRCLAERTSTFSISATPIAIPFSATDVDDDDGWHDPGGANPSRLTVPSGKGGKIFMIWAQTEYSGTGQFRLQIRVNGSTIVAMSDLTVGSSFTHQVTAMYLLADADYIECMFQNQTTGTTIVTDVKTLFGVMG